MDYLLIYKPDNTFFNKKKLKNLLKFLLKYLNLYNNQSLLNENSQICDLDIIKSKKNLFKNSTFGWIIKFLTNREVTVRMLSYNLLIKLVDS